MYELKDYLNAINYTKEPLLDTKDEQWDLIKILHYGIIALYINEMENGEE